MFAAVNINKRKILAQCLARTHTSGLLGRLRPAARDAIVIYAYHRILDVPEQHPFDLELISASRAQFDEQVSWLKKHTNPMTMADLADNLDTETPLPPRPSVITFDDGFVDNYSNAFPILKRHGVPATFFVSTGYIGEEKTFWFDWLAHCVLNPQWTTLKLDSLDVYVTLPDGEDERRQLLSRLLHKAKTITGEPEVALVAELLEHQAAHGDAASRQFSSTMTWDMLREMREGGMEIGSHGVGHYLLAKLSDEHLDQELTGSKATLDQELGQSTASIAYPVGSAEAADQRVFDNARRCGYRIGVVYDNGWNEPGQLSRFALSRKKGERDLTQAEFVCIRDMPGIY
jgi:peptidoglycan/xylan/chitin deacetylase (PgdA/CDA1 family)